MVCGNQRSRVKYPQFNVGQIIHLRRVERPSGDKLYCPYKCMRQDIIEWWDNEAMIREYFGCSSPAYAESSRSIFKEAKGYPIHATKRGHNKQFK